VEVTEVVCKSCGADRALDPPDSVCGACGARARLIQMTGTAVVTPRVELRGKAFDGKTGKWFAKIKAATELYHLENVWTHVMRVINRRENKYDEVITDAQTGAVRQECHEPLSEHQGHGSAKRTKKLR
jgi:hypothetical protein